MFGFGPVELLIFVVILIFLFRIHDFPGRELHGRGPFVGGYGAVPVDDPPPPSDSDSERNQP
jgi:hypothetical protein